MKSSINSFIVGPDLPYVTSLTAGANVAVTNPIGTGAATVGVTGVIPIANGGTGSSTQNFVDLTTAQTIGGVKTFSADATFSGLLNVTGTRIKLVLGTPAEKRFHSYNGGGVAEWIFGQKTGTSHDFILSKLVGTTETDMFRISTAGGMYSSNNTLDDGSGNVVFRNNVTAVNNLMDISTPRTFSASPDGGLIRFLAGGGTIGSHDFAAMAFGNMGGDGGGAFFEIRAGGSATTTPARKFIRAEALNSAAVNNIQFWTNNAQQMTIDANGAVTLAGRIVMAVGSAQIITASPTGLAGDPGFYSNNSNWLRFVTNGGNIQFFNDGNYGTTPSATINSTGLTVAGALTVNGAGGSFANSTANLGYQKLPGGLLLQWGNAIVGTTGTTINLPIGAPGGNMIAVGTPNSTNPAVTCTVSSWTATTITMYCSAASTTVYFFVIGRQ